MQGTLPGNWNISEVKKTIVNRLGDALELSALKKTSFPLGLLIPVAANKNTPV